MIVQTVRTRAAPAVERANAWLAERWAREGVMLAGLAALGLVVAGWYGVVRPLLEARQTAIARIELYETLQARLRAAPAGTAASPTRVIVPPVIRTDPANPGLPVPSMTVAFRIKYGFGGSAAANTAATRTTASGMASPPTVRVFGWITG